MSHKTIWVYRTPSEASEILDAPEELALWAKDGYFPKALPVAAQPDLAGPAGAASISSTGTPAESLTPAPETLTANPVTQLPEGSETLAAASDAPLTPPDAAGPETGAPAEAPKPEGKSKKG